MSSTTTPVVRSVSCGDINVIERTLMDALARELAPDDVTTAPFPRTRITTVMTKEELSRNNESRKLEDASVEGGVKADDQSKTESCHKSPEDAGQDHRLRPPKPKPRSKLTIASSDSDDNSGKSKRESRVKGGEELDVDSVSSISLQQGSENENTLADIKKQTKKNAAREGFAKKSLVSQKSVWNVEEMDITERDAENDTKTKRSTVAGNFNNNNNNIAPDTPVIVISDYNQERLHSSSSEFDIPDKSQNKTKSQDVDIMKNVVSSSNLSSTSSSASSKKDHRSSKANRFVGESGMESMKTGTATSSSDGAKNKGEPTKRNTFPVPKVPVAPENCRDVVGAQIFRNRNETSSPLKERGNISDKRKEYVDSLFAEGVDERIDAEDDDVDDESTEEETEDEVENLHSRYLDDMLSGGNKGNASRSPVKVQSKQSDVYIHQQANEPVSESSSSESEILPNSTKSAGSPQTVAENIQVLLSSNPEILRALRTDLQGLLDKRLRDLGIDPEWTRLPKKSYHDKVALLRHHKNITAKRYKTYFELQRQIERALEAYYAEKYGVAAERQPDKRKTPSTVYISNLGKNYRDNFDDRYIKMMASDSPRTEIDVGKMKEQPAFLTSTPRSSGSNEPTGNIQQRMTVSESDSPSGETTSIDDNIREREFVKPSSSVPLPKITTTTTTGGMLRNKTAVNNVAEPASGGTMKKQKRVIFLDEALASAASTPRYVGVQSIHVVPSESSLTKTEQTTDPLFSGLKRPTQDDRKSNVGTSTVQTIPVKTGASSKTESDSSGLVSVASSETRNRRPEIRSGSSTALSGSVTSLASLLDISPKGAGTARDELILPKRSGRRPPKEMESSDWDILDIEDNMRN